MINISNTKLVVVLIFAFIYITAGCNKPMEPKSQKTRSDNILTRVSSTSTEDFELVSYVDQNEHEYIGTYFNVTNGHLIHSPECGKCNSRLIFVIDSILSNPE